LHFSSSYVPAFYMYMDAISEYASRGFSAAA